MVNNFVKTKNRSKYNHRIFFFWKRNICTSKQSRWYKYI